MNIVLYWTPRYWIVRFHYMQPILLVFYRLLVLNVGSRKPLTLLAKGKLSECHSDLYSLECIQLTESTNILTETSFIS